MLTDQQFVKAKQFIFRQGRLLDRKYFLYHFENGPREAVLDVLKCYKNGDGGFGHGLEPDVMCPASTAICTEIAMVYLDDLGVTEGKIVDNTETWVIAAQQEDGSMSHPKAELVAYPYAPWWEDDSGSGLALAAFIRPDNARLPPHPPSPPAPAPGESGCTHPSPCTVPPPLPAR